MTVRPILAVASLAAALILTRPALGQSAQSCQTFSVVNQRALWNSASPFSPPVMPFSVPRFDPALGQLVNIQVALTGTISGVFRCENGNTIAPGVATLTTTAFINVIRPDFSAIASVDPQLVFVDALTSFDGVPDYGGTSGVTHSGVLSSPHTNQVTLSSPDDMALFAGPAGAPGALLIHSLCKDTSSLVGIAPATAQFNTTASLQLAICYNYVPSIHEAISREVSVSAGLTAPPMFTDAVSREVSVTAGLTNQPVFNEAVSREVSVSAGLTTPVTFNDVVSREVSVVTPTPQLALAALTTPSAGDAGTNFDLTWIIENVGNVDASGTWTEQVYRSTNAILGDADDVLVRTFTVTVTSLGPLEPGDDFPRTQSIPYGTTPGTYYFGVRLTGGVGFIDEDTTDNVRVTGLVTVINPSITRPDLVVEPFTIPVSAISGRTLSFFYRVKNQGVAATNAPSWIDRVYLTGEDQGSCRLKRVHADAFCCWSLATGLSATTVGAVHMRARPLQRCGLRRRAAA